MTLVGGVSPTICQDARAQYYSLKTTSTLSFFSNNTALQIIFNTTNGGVFRCLSSHYSKVGFLDLFTKITTHTGILIVYDEK